MGEKLQKSGESINIYTSKQLLENTFDLGFPGNKEGKYKQVYDSQAQEKHHLIIYSLRNLAYSKIWAKFHQ